MVTALTAETFGGESKGESSSAFRFKFAFLF